MHRYFRNKSFRQGSKGGLEYVREVYFKECSKIRLFAWRKVVNLMVSKSHFPIDFPTLSHCKSNIYWLDLKFIRKKIGCLWGSAMGKILDTLKIRFLILANFPWEILKQCTFSSWSRWLMAITSTIHGLWHCHPQSAWRRFIHTPWVMLYALGLVKIRRGEE